MDKLTKEQLLYKIVMNNKSLRNKLYKQLLKGCEGLFVASKEDSAALEELKKELIEHKNKKMEKYDVIVIGESKEEGAVLLDCGSVEVSGLFILTPYSSELDPTKKMEFLKDL